MDLTLLDRTSVAVGAAALAITQTILGGVFWLGTQSGGSAVETESMVVTTMIDQDVIVDDAAVEDACDPTFDEPAVCVIGAVLDGSGGLIIDLEYRNIHPDRVGFERPRRSARPPLCE